MTPWPDWPKSSKRGAGKTPTVIALIDRLSVRGRKVHVVSRGYGGSLEGPVRVEEARHTAAEVGDEPLLLSAFSPVWVARDRAAGVRCPESVDRDVLFMYRNSVTMSSTLYPYG